MRRIFLFAVILLMAVRGQSQITLLSDNRSVAVYVEAPSPGGFDLKNSTAPITPFDNPTLSVSAAIGWGEIGGWQAPFTSASASQDALFSPAQITFSSYLAVNSGGDPYGLHFPTGASGTARANSLFEITFAIADPLEFGYSLDFNISPILQTADCTLSSVNHGVQQLSRTHGETVTGLLEADTYTLRFDFSSLATGDHAGEAFSSMAFALGTAEAAVPEPSPSLLMELALVGFVVLRLKRAQGQTARAMALQRIRPVTRRPGRNAR